MNVRVCSLLCCFILAGFSSCTLKRLAVNHADRLAMYKIDDYFDLSDAQRTEIQPKVKAHVDWVKREKFPEVASLLSELKVKISDGFSAEELAWADQHYQRLKIELVERLAPDAAAFARTLAPAQLEHFEAELAKGDKRWEELLEESDAEIAKQRRKHLASAAERWMGDLSDEQKDQLGRDVGTDRAGVVAKLKDRQDVRRNAVQLLRTTKDQAMLEKTFRSWVRQPYLMRSPGALRKGFVERRKRDLTMIQNVDRGATPKQRQTFGEKIQEIVDLMRD